MLKKHKLGYEEEKSKKKKNKKHKRKINWV